MMRVMLWCFCQVACLVLLLLSFAACKRQPADNPARSTAATTNQPTIELRAPSDQFLSLMNAGKNYFDQGDVTNAIATYAKAAKLVPNDVDVHLNLANSYLISGAPAEAVKQANDVLQLEPNSAAAYFIKGSAFLRLNQPEDAAKALENAKRIEPAETATFFQLGLARFGLKQWDAAVSEFREGINMDPNHLHSAAHYLLAQALLRAGHQAEAEKELQEHQINTEGGAPGLGAATFERSKYTQARVPFKLDQPEKEGVKVQFVDATKEVFPGDAERYTGPLGIIDVNHSGVNSLFVLEKTEGFRLLMNTNGIFQPFAAAYPAIPESTYYKLLVGDLQNDRFEDIIVLGDKGSHLFKFQTNGLAMDVAPYTGLNSVRAVDGVLADLDFTGKLDLLVTTGTTNAGQLRVYRQFGPLLFSDITSTSGIPASLTNAQAVLMEDWNRDGIMDAIVTRVGVPPLLLEKQRGGPLSPRAPTNWVAGAFGCSGDFDNDLRPDLALLDGDNIRICFNGGERVDIPISEPNAPKGNSPVRQLVAFDYDNDGWLDLWAVGETLRVWRNLGLSGFKEVTQEVGLRQFHPGSVAEIHIADFDMDCDSDIVVELENGGLRYLRNEGGNANSQIKVQLYGNRSNASGIGCKVEIETGALRLIRTVHQLPVEIGVGKYQQLDSFVVHWFNWPQGSAEVPFDCRQPLLALELTIQEGSCPFLYAWDGRRFQFVTDILGAAPLGLPVADGKYIEADPDEFVWIGNEKSFPPKDGNYEIRITEELREVLYLDEVKLVVVDHEPGSEVHPTDKLLPGKPFPPGGLLTLHREHRLMKAETLEGKDVTSTLQAIDGKRVSPPHLREPQLRGLAEPHGVVLDFGELDASKPLVLVMNGWLRFGGGMANIAASHDSSLPFPFPVLEAEVAPGTWKRIDVTVGAPAGKTKTILVDLEGRLQPGTRRLRLTEAFEIHWDRIALLEKKIDARSALTCLPPNEANLHFRGFSPMRNLPDDWPLTPDYDTVSPNSYWTVTPGGWCTRYGDVMELVASRDEGLVLMNGGDELTLKFAQTSIPPKKPNMEREFFLFADGWDKDSDFHVASGTTVEPLPFHGMNDQLYGREKRSSFPSDALHLKYNTRWVEGKVLKQTASR